MGYDAEQRKKNLEAYKGVRKCIWNSYEEDEYNARSLEGKQRAKEIRCRESISCLILFYLTKPPPST